jgi:hypothetical protein
LTRPSKPAGRWRYALLESHSKAIAAWISTALAYTGGRVDTDGLGMAEECIPGCHNAHRVPTAREFLHD